MALEVQERVKRFRKERGLTVRRLAERAGCTHSYISQLEKGTTVPSLSMVGKLAAALGINVVDLFNEPPATLRPSIILQETSEKRSIILTAKSQASFLCRGSRRRKWSPCVSEIQAGGVFG
jgi:transcriptional regulator with XRE-family HTH domain